MATSLSHHDLELAAYYKWLKRGRPLWDDCADWFAPEADTPGTEPVTERYRILSFDGGGVHALSYLPILDHLERYLGEPIHQSNQFRLLVGTSTGTIAAAAMKLGLTAQQIIDLYRDNAKAIFTPLAPWNQVFHRYSSKTLNKVLATYFVVTDTTTPLLWSDLCNLPSANPSLELIVTLWNVSTGKTCYLSTNAQRPGQEKDLYRATVADIITACCSAPYYFPPRAFRGGDIETVYCDGGITGLNNPAVYATALVIDDLRPHGTSTPLQVLSFGSGKGSGKHRIEDMVRWTAMDAVLNTVDALMTSSSVLMDDFYRMIGGYLGVTCFRTNQPRESSQQLDAISDIPHLLQHYTKERVTYHLFPADHESQERVLSPLAFEHLCEHDFALPGKSVMGDLPLFDEGADAYEPTFVGNALHHTKAIALYALAWLLDLPMIVPVLLFRLYRSLRRTPASAASSWEVRASWLTNASLTSRVGLAVGTVMALIGAVVEFRHLSTIATDARKKAEWLRDKQTTISECESLATNATVRLSNQPPELLPSSLLLAAEAVKRLDAIGERSVDTDRALRTALALAPRLQHSFGTGSDVVRNGFTYGTARDELIVANRNGTIWSCKTGSEQLDKVFDLREDVALFATSSDASVFALVATKKDPRFPNDPILGQHNDRAATVFDRATKKLIVLPRSSEVTDIAMSPDGRFVATICDDGVLTLWDVKKQALVTSRDFKAPMPAGGILRHQSWFFDHLSFSDQGALLAFSVDRIGNDQLPQAQANHLRDESHEVFIVSTPKLEDKGHMELDGLTRGVRLRSDGNYVAAASRRGSVKVRNLKTHTDLVLPAADNERESSCLAFSISDDRLAVCYARTIVRIWDITTGSCVATMRHESTINMLGFTSNGSYAMTAGNDSTARLWRSATGKEVARMVCDGRVDAIASNASGTTIATAGRGGTIDVYAAPDHPSMVTANLDEQSAHGLFADFLVPDKPAFRCCPQGNTFYLVNENRVSGPFGDASPQPIAHAVFHAATDTLAVAHAKRVVLWNVDPSCLQARRKAAIINTKKQPLWCCFSQSGASLTVIERESNAATPTCEIFRCGDGSPIREGEGLFYGRMWYGVTRDFVALQTMPEMVEAEQGQSVRTTRETKRRIAEVRIVSTDSGRDVIRLEIPGGLVLRPHDFSNSGTFAYAVDKTVRVVGLRSFHNIDATYTFGGEVGSCRFEGSNKDRLVIVESHDGATYYHVYREGDMTPLTSWSEQWGKDDSGKAVPEKATYFAVSADCKYIALGGGGEPSEAGQVKVASLHDGRVIHILRHGERIKSPADNAMTERVGSVAFSDDGTLLSSSGSRGLVYLWEMETGKQVAIVEPTDPTQRNGESDVLTDFSKDSKYLLTWSGNAFAPGYQRKLGAWLTRPEDLIAETCRRVRRNLNQDEWGSLMGDKPHCKTCDSLR
jgi:WD40 repeat protein